MWSHTYSYDKVGNRTAKDGVTYTINTVNEVTGLSDGISFTYDSNGNRTQKTKGTDTWTYTYDYVNRLTKVEKNSTTIGEYVYDGDGRRIQATETSETTTYINAGFNVIYEENASGSVTYICFFLGFQGLIVGFILIYTSKRMAFETWETFLRLFLLVIGLVFLVCI